MAGNMVKRHHVAARTLERSFLVLVLWLGVMWHSSRSRVFAGCGGLPLRIPSSQVAGRLAAISLRAQGPKAVAGEPEETFDSLFLNDQRPVVLYDGVCNMCNSAVDVALEKDPDGKKLRFAALQSDVGRGLLAHCGRDPGDLSSMIVVCPDGSCLAQSDAALFVGKQLESSPVLRGTSEVLSRMLPKGMRDKMYDTIANNRYRVLGKRQELRTGEGDTRASRFLGKMPAAAASS